MTTTSHHQESREERIRRAIEKFGRQSLVFREWSAIHSDFGHVCADGIPRVIIWVPGQGSTLTEWFGPQPPEF
ncbi:hypothetical protein GCM10027060_26400 [Nesterenkonia halophila]